MIDPATMPPLIPMCGASPGEPDPPAIVRTMPILWSQAGNSDPTPMTTSVPIVAPASDHFQTDKPQPGHVAHHRLGFVSLEPLAAALDGMEDVRIANENRLRSVVAMGADPDTDPDAMVFAAIVDGLAKLEHEAVLALQRGMRRHPLGPFVKATLGLGEKQTARLLSAIGDPYLRDVYDDARNFIGTKPRTVSQLWALCGYHVLPADTHRIGDAHRSPGVGGQSSGDTDQGKNDAQVEGVGVAPFPQRGQRANWNPTAKMRAFLIAESCVKQSASPYRKVYDEGRAKYADSIHPATCKRCGPAGKPAQPGSPLNLGHQHARALRLVAKAILRDLWIESKRLHDADE